jgi:DNA uptake protein ComE-like DNA-binding protein
MNDRIKDYFSYSRKEQRGLIILLGLMLLSLAANIFLPYFIPEKQFDMTPFQEEVDRFLAAVDSVSSYPDDKSINFQPGYKKEDNSPVLIAFKASPFYFDPNEVTEEELKKMGMDEKVARNIIHYREKGGKFRDKEGFSRIYGMTDSIISILSPYIKIDEKITSYKTYKYDTLTYGNKYKDSLYGKYHTEKQVIELNTADSAALLELTGIGPSFSGRIIRYRERLGGFYRKEQLYDIKGMDSIRFNQFRNQLTVDPGLIRKIDLNAVTFKDLMKHPYFEYYLVKAIFQYKDDVKAFDSIGQLKKIPVMYEELYFKISQYLEVK